MARSIYKSAAGEKAIKSKYNDLLRHWPVAKEELHIETRHGKTFVIASGSPDAPPLLLFHGSGASSIVWLNDVETYCKYYRVYAIDVIGEPNHSAPNRPSSKGPAYAEWVEDIYSELKINKAALVGASIGAWACLKFACGSPERVDRLALLSPVGIVRKRTSFKIKALLLLLLGPFAKKILNWHVRRGANINPKFVDYNRFTLKYFRYWLTKVRRFSDKELGQLYCPILLIVGGKDVLYSAKKSLLRLARTVPALEVNYRAREGHLLTECAREIDRFLSTEYPPESA